MTEPESQAKSSVRNRLNEALMAYLATVDADDIDAINVEHIARLAGVGRATAYRHFGDERGLLYDAAIKVARNHTEALRAKLASKPTVASALEESFSHAAQSMARDPILRLLMTSRGSPAIHDALGALGQEILGPLIRAGQVDGQVRSDVAEEELLIWLSEMQYVAVRLALDEDSVRRWVRTFVLPTLKPARADAGLVAQISAVLSDLEARADALTHSLEEARIPLDAAHIRESGKVARRVQNRRD